MDNNVFTKCGLILAKAININHLVRIELVSTQFANHYTTEVYTIAFITSDQYFYFNFKLLF